MASRGRRSSDWRAWLRPDEAPLPGTIDAGVWRGRRIKSWPLTGLFVLASVYTLALARAFLIPLAVGVMLYFLLRPPVRALKQARVPEPAGAALVLLALVSAVGVGVYALSWPAAAWAARAPESITRVQTKLSPLARRVQRLTRTAEEMQRITDVGGGPASATPRVQIKEPSVGALFVGGMQSFLAGTVVVLTLVYFLLAEGDELMRRVVAGLPRLKDRESAVVIAREMERQLSAYLFFTTVLNVAFGIFIALVMWGLGMPNPALWGVVAGVTKFIPYLGGLLCTVVLALASMLTFDQIGWALLVPGVFLVIDTIHGNVVMPVLLGKRFTLDPAMLFVGLFFWWFVWGTGGALLAVPIMSAVRIFCEHIDGLERFAALLGGTRVAHEAATTDALAPSAAPPV
jgi:predicted PurR-regulated permease PerM